MTDAPVQSNPRQALRVAIERREAMRGTLGLAADAQDRSRQLLRGAEAKLRSFGDVDGAILQHRAASYRTAAQDGSKPSLDLPEELLRRERARDEAAAAVAAARAAYNSIVGEFAEAQGALRKAEKAASDLAAAVIIDEVGETAFELGDIWATLWSTIDRLKALAMAGVHLSPEPLRALNSFDALDYRQFAGGHNEQLAKAVHHWKAYREALTKNADAVEGEVSDHNGDGRAPAIAGRAA